MTNNKNNIPGPTGYNIDDSAIVEEINHVTEISK